METKKKNYEAVERTLVGIIIAVLVSMLPDYAQAGAILGILISRGKL